MRILIVGASGMVGGHLLRDLRQSLGRRASILGTYHTNAIDDGIPLDIRDSHAVERCLTESKPDATIWLAGLKNVPQLEREPELSSAINESPIHRAVESLAAVVPNSRLIYLSSDYVFRGKRGGYRDTDQRLPDTAYGRSKVFAEDVVMNSGLDAVCVRTAAIMSMNGGFLRWLLNELAASKPVSLFSNTIFSPTPPSYLSRAFQYLLEAGTMSPAVNFAGPPLSRYSMGRYFCARFGYAQELVHEAMVDLSNSTLHANLSLVTSDELEHLAPHSIDDFTPETCA